jgi:hypothetical protein
VVRRLSFLGGLLVGSGLCAWFLGAALTYIFTGRILSLQAGSEGIQLKLHELALRESLPREEA